MQLLEKILTERICELCELSHAEIAQVQGNPELANAIAANRELATLNQRFPAAPPRPAMLTRVAAAASTSGGTDMHLFTRLFHGRRWFVQAGAAALILLAVVVIALIPHGTTFAQTNGYMLVYDFGPVEMQPGLEGHCAAAEGQVKELEAAVRAWVEARKAEQGAESKQNRIAISVNIDNGVMQATVALAEADEALLAELKAAIAKVPGLPEPTVTDATWFHEQGLFNCAAGLRLKIMDHIFTFPEGTSEETMEQQINDWLKTAKPDEQFTVDVQVTDDGERREVKILLKGPDQP